MGRRFFAGLIDGVVILPVGLLAVWLGVPGSNGKWLVGIVAGAMLDVLGVALYGATPGKALMGLRVRSTTDERVGLRRAAIRTGVSIAATLYWRAVVALQTAGDFEIEPNTYLVLLCGWWGIGLFIYLPVLVGKDRRGRHDRAAGSTVVAVRGASRTETRRDAYRRILSQGSSYPASQR
ncbi:MAG: RDD family protein [Acidimicrobiales bacterium]